MPGSLENQISQKVIEVIQRHSYQRRDVGLESEIYYDLNIYGSELWEALKEIGDSLSIDLKEIDLASVAPGEGFEPISWAFTKLGFRPFKSLKVIDLVQIAMRQARGIDQAV